MMKKIVEEIIQKLELLKGSGSTTKADPLKLEELKAREIRWQDAAINQLSFFNNLLMILGVGFLGFAFDLKNLPEFYFSPDHCSIQVTVLFFCIVCMVLSVLAGLLCAFTRILDFNHTHRVNRIRRKFYEKNPQLYKGTSESYPVYPAVFYWFYKPPFSHVAEKEFIDNPEEVKKKVQSLSNLITKLGKLTRFLVKAQLFLFFISILLFGYYMVGF